MKFRLNLLDCSKRPWNTTSFKYTYKTGTPVIFCPRTGSLLVSPRKSLNTIVLCEGTFRGLNLFPYVLEPHLALIFKYVLVIEISTRPLVSSF